MRECIDAPWRMAGRVSIILGGWWRLASRKSVALQRTINNRRTPVQSYQWSAAASGSVPDGDTSQRARDATHPYHAACVHASWCGAVHLHPWGKGNRKEQANAERMGRRPPKRTTVPGGATRRSSEPLGGGRGQATAGARWQARRAAAMAIVLYQEGLHLSSRSHGHAHARAHP